MYYGLYVRMCECVYVRILVFACITANYNDYTNYATKTTSKTIHTETVCSKW